MYSGVSASHVGIVHEVVMEEGVVMVCLQSAGCREYGVRIVLVEVITHEHEYWAYALASQREDIAYRLVERLWLACVGDVVKVVVDKCKDIC